MCDDFYEDYDFYEEEDCKPIFNELTTFFGPMFPPQRTAEISYAETSQNKMSQNKTRYTSTASYTKISKEFIYMLKDLFYKDYEEKTLELFWEAILKYKNRWKEKFSWLKAKQYTLDEVKEEYSTLRDCVSDPRLKGFRNMKNEDYVALCGIGRRKEIIEALYCMAETASGPINVTLNDISDLGEVYIEAMYLYREKKKKATPKKKTSKKTAKKTVKKVPKKTTKKSKSTTLDNKN